MDNNNKDDVLSSSSTNKGRLEKHTNTKDKEFTFYKIGSGDDGDDDSKDLNNNSDISNGFYYKDKAISSESVYFEEVGDKELFEMMKVCFDKSLSEHGPNSSYFLLMCDGMRRREPFLFERILNGDDSNNSDDSDDNNDDYSSNNDVVVKSKTNMDVRRGRGGRGSVRGRGLHISPLFFPLLFDNHGIRRRRRSRWRYLRNLRRREIERRRRLRLLRRRRRRQSVLFPFIDDPFIGNPGGVRRRRIRRRSLPRTRIPRRAIRMKMGDNVTSSSSSSVLQDSKFKIIIPLSSNYDDKYVNYDYGNDENTEFLTEDDISLILERAKEITGKIYSELRTEQQVDSKEEEEEVKIANPVFYITIISTDGHYDRFTVGDGDPLPAAKSISLSKAVTSFMWSTNDNAWSTRSLKDASELDKSDFKFTDNVILTGNIRSTLIPGGLPIYKPNDNGKWVKIGAIGVSGDTPYIDEVVAYNSLRGFNPPVEIRSDAISKGKISYIKDSSVLFRGESFLLGNNKLGRTLKLTKDYTSSGSFTAYPTKELSVVHSMCLKIDDKLSKWNTKDLDVIIDTSDNEPIERSHIIIRENRENAFNDLDQVPISIFYLNENKNNFILSPPEATSNTKTNSYTLYNDIKLKEVIPYKGHDNKTHPWAYTTDNHTITGMFTEKIDKPITYLSQSHMVTMVKFKNIDKEEEQQQTKLSGGGGSSRILNPDMYFDVRLALKQPNHPYWGKGSPYAYTLNGAHYDKIVLNLKKYTDFYFRISTPGHPFGFTKSNIGGIIKFVLIDGQKTPLEVGLYKLIIHNDNAKYLPDSFYYQCSIHPYMGGIVEIIK